MSAENNSTGQYDFRAIERKWQQRWEEAQLFRVEIRHDRPKFYGLDMFPYPSGAGLSVGHCRNYIPLDVACRLKVLQGYNVLHPMGWDAFGQPAENEAIKRGRNPKEMVQEYAANYRRQLKLVGISYDWSREINSSSPEYYRWTQWIFLQLYKNNLAYRANAPVNWCTQCKTVLANEEVVNGRCWRCGSLVEKRQVPQWFFRITAYAEKLLEGLQRVNWPEGVKALQANWIGRSEGAEIVFPVEGHPETIPVFTTRPDTLWGATFMVLAPEHPLVDKLTTPEYRAQVEAYKERAQRTSEIDRQNVERAKTGVFIGSYCINPINGERIPIYIADYVLMGYGTGAIMAVPAHDQRDFEFAKRYGLPIRLVYRISEEQTAETLTEALPDGGTMVNTGPFEGSPNTKETIARVIAYLEERGIGRGVVTYRLRDWLISRQRYWGAPIPIIHCPACGEVPVPEDQLPVLLPPVERYEPTGTGESPLAGIPEFVNTTCPRCNGPARRETDTMGGSACSSWYYLRFADPHNDKEAFSQEAVRYWLPVDLYAGGAEHAVGHLLYARFWTKALHDMGYLHFDEPFLTYRNQGAVLAYTPGREVGKEESGEEEEIGADEPIENWKVLKPEERETIPPEKWVWRWVRMSKSKGNVVTPDEMAERYGSDSLRLFLLFVAPYEENVQWSDKGMEGAHRFVNRIWRIWNELRPHYRADWRQHMPPLGELSPADRALRRKLHQTIRKVESDIEHFRFNTAVAALMEYTNELSAYRNAVANREPTPVQAYLISEALETLPILFSPITPHMADEWWERLGKEGFTFNQCWPEYDPEVAKEEQITVVVQVNGKIRDKLQVSPETPSGELERLALASARVQNELNGRVPQKVVVVPQKLVNIVVSK